MVLAPFFGTFLTGAPGIAFYLVLALLWAYASRAIYRLDVRGWWIVLFAFCLFMVSSLS